MQQIFKATLWHRADALGCAGTCAINGMTSNADGTTTVRYAPTFHATKRGACDALLALSKRLVATDAVRDRVREHLAAIVEGKYDAAGGDVGERDAVGVHVWPVDVGP